MTGIYIISWIFFPKTKLIRYLHAIESKKFSNRKFRKGQFKGRISLSLAYYDPISTLPIGVRDCTRVDNWFIWLGSIMTIGLVWNFNMRNTCCNDFFSFFAKNMMKLQIYKYIFIKKWHSVNVPECIRCNYQL